MKRLGLVAVFIVVVAMACLVGSMVYRQDGGEKSMAQSSLKFRKSPQKLNRETLAATILSGANNKSILDDSSNGICASKGVVLDKLNSLAAKLVTDITNLNATNAAKSKAKNDAYQSGRASIDGRFLDPVQPCSADACLWRVLTRLLTRPSKR